MTNTILNLYAQRDEVHYSDWFLVDQGMIDRFADATLDHQYIHVDPQRSADSAFGGTIAHGFLTLSLLVLLRDTTPSLSVPDASTVVNVGLNRVRFVHPVRSGSRVRAKWQLMSIEEKAQNVFQCTDDVTVEIENEAKPAMVAAWITRFLL